MKRSHDPIICRLAGLIALSGAILTCYPVTAMESGEFLKLYEGSWKGGGNVQQSLESDPIQVRCAISITLDEPHRTLENTGRCATTSGKRKVNGSISYSDSGNNLTGTFLNGYGNIEVLKSSGSYDDEAMTFDVTHQNKATEKVGRSRTIVSRPDDDRFQSSIYEYDRKRQAFIKIGELEFTR